MTIAVRKIIIEENFDLVESTLDDIDQSDDPTERTELAILVMQMVDSELEELAGESRVHWLMTSETEGGIDA